MLEQTPKAGSNAPKDSEVKLVVAKAPPEVAVPDVGGNDLQGARDALHAAGLQGLRQLTARSRTRRRTAS